MAAPNIDKRRLYVDLFMYKYGDIKPFQMKYLARRFNCSTSAIYSDMAYYNRTTSEPVFPSQSTKENVFKRDNYTCQYCGKSNKFLIAEHVIPFIIDGCGREYNLVASCEKCNSIKKGRQVWIPRNFNVLFLLNSQNGMRILTLANRDFRTNRNILVPKDKIVNMLQTATFNKVDKSN